MAELSFRAKKMKQTQNVRTLRTMAATMKKHPLKLIMIISYIKYGMNQLGLACKKKRERKNKTGTVRTEMNVYHFYRRHHNQFPVVQSDGIW